MDEFACEAMPGGAGARFRYDSDRLASFRSVFPNARWQKEAGTWFLPDPGALGRVNLWITERRRQEREADEAGRKAAEIESIEHPRVTKLPDGWAVKTPYDAAVLDVLRKLPGAAWHAGLKRWIARWRSTETLRGLLPRLSELADQAAARDADRARGRYRGRSPLRR